MVFRSGEGSDRLLHMTFFRDSDGVPRWREMLERDEGDEAESALRKATYAGNPLAINHL
jgi:hypothetical protein